MRIFVISVAVGWLVANAALAAEPCKAPGACTEVQTCGTANHCGHCGCVCQCEKHCCVVCEMKEVKKTVWVVKCEDFCAPLPGCPHGCCKSCNGGGSEACCAEPTCCEGCGNKCDPCAAERKKCCVPPKCGKVRTRKVLEAKTVVCTLPCYKCVVVYTCPNCSGSERCSEQTPAAPAKPEMAPSPPPPAPSKTTERAPFPPELSLTR
ncbi:MAG: hypothetical protein WCB27_15720 [Thermoguttaceae bacterium]|jgi:hypothetical protein